MNDRRSVVSRFTLSFAVFLVVSIASASGDFAAPKAKKTVAPNLTFKTIDEAGEVELTAKINQYGFVMAVAVESSSNQSLNEACIDAMHRWTFSPAEKNGTPIPSTVSQLFVFNDGAISLARKGKEKTGFRAPKAIHRVPPSMSTELANVNGQVNFLVDLDNQGEVSQITLKSATHRELVGPAEEALKQWKFRPAEKNGVKVASTVVTPFKFEASDWSIEETRSRSYEIDLVDSRPSPIKKHEPVLPLALEKRKGDAWLLLYVDEHGYVATAETLKASDSELAKHAREAALDWKFKPAMKDGVPVASKVSVPFRFTGGLLLAERPVDKRPKAKRRVSPILPKGLSKSSGYVRVMLELDSRGNVLDARAKQSSRADLEGPTLEAAMKWKFSPAVRNGDPVPSTILIPFNFKSS